MTDEITVQTTSVNAIFDRYSVKLSQDSSLRGERTAFILRQMIVEKSPNTVFTPLDDGTGVLLNLETRFYYNLNRTGVALWQEIERSNHPTLESLIEATCKRFDVAEAGARQEIVAFVERLEDFKMVRIR